MPPRLSLKCSLMGGQLKVWIVHLFLAQMNPCLLSQLPRHSQRSHKVYRFCILCSPNFTVSLHTVSHNRNYVIDSHSPSKVKQLHNFILCSSSHDSGHSVFSSIVLICKVKFRRLKRFKMARDFLILQCSKFVYYNLPLGSLKT